jgi:lipopolysaccharide transport system ATP-binding protein
MSRPAITCDHLSKRYRLGTHRSPGMHGGPPSLRETISGKLQAARSLLKGDRYARPNRDHEFWALKDVSFEVGQGEVIGIVGRNGAGKSTLLKILSRIVEPTEGSVRLRGRIASLLEVGTGFHPELTGRENIYLNGAILGMTKAEIDRKFDEIVAFSEIEEFLDTPVKRYSSGMYVRLAFAVAAHLEPEILIVDEVLAVGDYAFQKKCLGKMQDVATDEGRTILFVSHNMGALAQLCRRGILLQGGKITADGPIRDVIAGYLNAVSDHRTAQAVFPVDPSKPCQFLSAAILREDGTMGSEFGCDEPFVIRLEFEVRQATPNMKVYLDLYTLDGVRLFNSDVRDGDPSIVERLGVGRHIFEIRVPGQLLGGTTYLMNIACEHLTGELVDGRLACCEFTLRDTLSPWSNRPGYLSVLLPWRHHRGPIPAPAEPVPAGAI